MNDNIIIGFSKAKGFKPFSWLIQRFEKTPYSHVYIKVYSKHFGDYDIYQASKGFVNHLTESVFLEHNEVVREFILECKSKLTLIDYCRKKLGIPYSLLSLFGIFLRRFGIKSKLFSDKDKAYICSELAAKILIECNIAHLQEDLDYITPKQLYEIIEKITN